MSQTTASATEVMIPACLARENLATLGVVVLEDPPATSSETDVTKIRVELPDGWFIAEDPDIKGRSYIIDHRGIRRVSMWHNQSAHAPCFGGNIIGFGNDTVLRLLNDGATLKDIGWEVMTDEERSQVVACLHEYVNQIRSASLVSGRRGAIAKTILHRISTP